MARFVSGAQSRNDAGRIYVRGVSSCSNVRPLRLAASVFQRTPAPNEPPCASSSTPGGRQGRCSSSPREMGTMRRKNRTPAVAYLRTSSAANVGADKDSDVRQRQAIEAFAKLAGYDIVAEFYDAAVSGADPIEMRPGFAAMLEHIASNGARTIIVETANRFARDLIVQETGHRILKDRGIEIIAADSPGVFVDDTPTTTFVRQVLGAVAELDKAMIVAKLRGARERKRRQVGWCEGGAPLHER